MKKQQVAHTSPLIERVKAVMAAKGLKARAWSLLASRLLGSEDPDIVRNILRGKSKSPRGDTLMALAQAAGIDVNYLMLRSNEMGGEGSGGPLTESGPPERNATPAPLQPPARGDMPKDLPVLGIVEGGPDGAFFFDDDGTPIDYVRRPPRLAGVSEAYALYVQGESMRPWREAGQLVMVAPRIPVQIGDYVAVQLRDHEYAKAGLVKRLYKRTAKEVQLEQFNPPKILKYPVERVVRMHRIMEWTELMGA